MDNFANHSPLREKKTLRRYTSTLKRLLTILIGAGLFSAHANSTFTESKKILPTIENQDFTVSGTVSDDTGQVLPGATILEKGTSNGVTSDFDGNFTISVSDADAILVVSYVGYTTNEFSINGQSSLNITLNQSAAGLDEVVVIGYGSVKKADLTGSVSQVKTDVLESVPVYNVEQVLKGRSAGVSVKQNSGAPGGRTQIRIRGGNSMIGSNQPLYVVDGFPITGNIDFINPSDIQSLDILKDASATAIYGSRGANGVVVITLKKGKSEQKSRISLNSRTGFQVETNRYEMLNARQYAEVANEWLRNSGQTPFFNLSEVQNPGTNWQDAIFRTAVVQDHTLTLSGGGEKTRFSLSGNYFDQEGLIKHTEATRTTLRLNLDHKFNDHIDLSANINYSRNKIRRLPVDNAAHGASVLSGALAAPPTLPIYDEQGQAIQINQVYSFGSIGMINPVNFFPPRKDVLSNDRVLGNTSLSVDILEGLTFKTRFGFEYSYAFTDFYEPIIYSGDRGLGSQASSNDKSTLVENTFDYTKQLSEKHKIDFLAGYTFQNFTNRSFGIAVNGFANNITQNFDLGSAETVNNPTSDFSEWTLNSWLSRINYSFDNKYLITASIRADGSSRFGKNNKWGIFPSGAFAWRISEESFMDKIKFVSSLKFRASYGLTGNTGLNPYQSIDRISSVRTINGSNTEEVGFVSAGIANPDLKWETTKQLDIGFDLGLFNNRLNIVFDYYKKNTTDLLASTPLPPSVGFANTLRNIGEIQNKGIELSLESKILTKGFKWDISAQMSANRNEVISLAGGSDIFGRGVGIFGNISLAREGEPFGVYHGFIEDGLDEQGYIKYMDLNNDGVIDPQDRTILGSPYPDFVYGFNSNFSYKNFVLSLFFEGSQGNDIWWATAGSHLNSFQRGSNQFSDLYGNYWTPENPDPNARYPRVSNDSQIGDSNRFVKDGSYLRLGFVNLAYNLPTERMPFLDSAQIYVSGTNIFTITNYPGINPDVNSTGNDSQDITTRLTQGVDQSTYPLNRIFSLGVKLNF